MQNEVRQLNPHIEYHEGNLNEMINNNNNKNDEEIEDDPIPNEKILPSEIKVPQNINLKNFKHFEKHKHNLKRTFFNTII